MSNSSIRLINRTLSGATTPGQRGSGHDGREDELCIPKSSSCAETSPSDCLILYAGHSLEESYPSAEIQSVYSTVDWARRIEKPKIKLKIK